MALRRQASLRAAAQMDSDVVSNASWGSREWGKRGGDVSSRELKRATTAPSASAWRWPRAAAEGSRQASPRDGDHRRARLARATQRR